MTDLEYDILDELYFVTSFRDLQNTLSIDEGELKLRIEDMMEKGWVKCLKSVSEEQPFNSTDFNMNYLKYHYLATKAGLLAHNRKD